MSDGEAFFAAIRQAQEAQSKPPTFPFWEAQMQALRELHAKTGDMPPLFVRGDIVRYIGCAGGVQKVEPDGVCFMFWRMLDYDTADDQQRIVCLNPAMLIRLDEVDCLLALFDGDSFAFHLSSTALLERDPRQDKHQQ